MANARILRKTFHQATIILLLLVLLHHASAQTSTEHHNFHGHLDRSTIIMMIVIVGVFFILGCFCVYIRQCSNPATTSFVRMAIPQGLDHEVLNAFPSFQYSRVKNRKIGKRSLECAICLCEFEDHDILRLLPKCNHVFHSDCVDTWLESRTTCPVCRADLLPNPGETFTSLNFDSDELEAIKVRSIAEMSSSSRGVSCGSSPISWPTKLQFGRFLPRSHSTGHSFVQHGGDVDRFTLILPENVRAELINTAFKRTKSCQFDLPTMTSTKSGYKSEGSSNKCGKGYNLYERFNRARRLDGWEFSSTPPFIRNSRSTMLQGNGDGERVTTSRRSLTKSVTMPIGCLFPEMETNTERSFVQLKFNSQV